ncbi:transcriptional regulator [Methylobacterium durans]|uniref:transcriptional regulator n=1 Tax=Methylobacterium durans TaxID=2202825 RepID=UPI003AADB1EB
MARARHLGCRHFQPRQVGPPHPRGRREGQRFIRTLHGQGFRFVADVRIDAPERIVHATPQAVVEDTAGSADADRPSIAILPFRLAALSPLHPATGEAIAHDLITALSRLRWLFVIARGSSFRFRQDDVDAVRVGRSLHVRYALSGFIEAFANRVTITVELAETRTGGVLWGDRFASAIDDIHDLRARIAASIIAALEIRVPLHEAARAALAVPNSLDAWSAYHLGLRHLYRFNPDDNAAAAALFARAVTLDPSFARANAGLSATHFQSAFLRYSGDPDREARAARRHAERGVELDPLDPFANVTLGRAFWLSGEVDRSLPWLERSTELSPSYAHGFYARAWADTVAERDRDGCENVDAAIALSPLDPFLYAMLATRALACLITGDAEQAAAWADKAARSPGAHVMISLIAVIAHTLNGDPQRAAIWLADVIGRRGDVTQAHFFASFPFRDGAVRRRIAKALADNGFS